MALPRYEQIKDDIISQIKAGKFQPGDKFYSESELIKIYNTSSITIIRALKEISNSGYLTSIQGKGRFIGNGKIEQLVRYTEIETHSEQSIDKLVIKISESKNTHIRKILKLMPEQKLYCFERIRKSNGDPYYFQYTYISSEFINSEDIKNPDLFISIYGKLRHDFGYKLETAHSVEYYQISYPTPVYVAKYLNIDSKVPTHYGKRTTYLESGFPVEYVESYKKSDYFKVKIENV